MNHAVFTVIAAFLGLILGNIGYRVVKFFPAYPWAKTEKPGNACSPWFLLEILGCYVLVSFLLSQELTVVSTLKCFMLCQLLLLATFDYYHYLLPDSLTLSLLWLGLISSSLGYGIAVNEAVIGAALGYISLWIMGYLFKKIRKKSGLGGGDYKLLAALGAWFGAEPLITIMMVATTLGSLTGLFFILHKKYSWNRPLPFGVFLTLGAYIELIFIF